MVVHPFSSFFRERDNAGLNVTCASRVFLVESVVNHGFEVQGRFVPGLSVTIISPITAAIARIDRMGQTKPTEGVSAQPYSARLLLNLYRLSSLLLLCRGYYPSPRVHSL